MQKSIRLRFRLYAMILPLVAASVLISGVLASLESRAALTRIANRHLAFVAEQLRDYLISEWAVITELGLAGQPEYRKAAEDSFRSYAFSLLRSDTELIVAFDSSGAPVMRIETPNAARGTAELKNADSFTGLKEGWFSGTVLGQDRVGVAFGLEPFGWTVAVTELDSAFFSDVRNIQKTHFWILVVSIVVLTVFLSIFIGHIIRPVERLTGTIGRITEKNDLTERAQIEVADEIGTLAYKFNSMISMLQENYLELEATSLAEKKARQTAVEREEETLNLLGNVSDFRDEETGQHLKRIGSFAALFADLLGLGEDKKKLLMNAAPLHDIGKIAIPDAILLKKGRLTTEEFEVIKRHTVLGHALLKDAKSIYLVEGAAIALSHHEKWDGTGYPAGLAGEDIPLSGRIVSVIDVFDALTSERPYKEAWSPEKALDLIVEQRGKHFDPRLVDLFVENFATFRAMLAQ